MAAPQEPTPPTNAPTDPTNPTNPPQSQPLLLPPQQEHPAVPPVCELRRNIDIRATFDEIRETVQADNPKGFSLWDFMKDVYKNAMVWRVFKGFLTLLVAYKLAYEFEFVGSLKDYWEFDWGSVRDYFYSEDY